MTTRDYFVSVLNAHISPELDEASQILLRKLDEKNAKRKATPTKEQKAASARRGTVLGFFQEHPTEVFTRDQIAEALGVTPGQVSSACTKLGDAVRKTEAKIDGARRVVYQYAGN